MRHGSNAGGAFWRATTSSQTEGWTRTKRFRHASDLGAKRALDAGLAAFLLLVLSPLIALVLLAIVLESGRPLMYRARRLGRGGREFPMLKFRKMTATASGLPLTIADDERFTRVGRFLAASKLDEIPQLWNVLRGQMSLVGPRPEDPEFVELEAAGYEIVHRVRPGITGLTQLAFARESEILDVDDRMAQYVSRLLPQKVKLDCLYVGHRTLAMDLQILWWTAAAVLFRRSVAVHRNSGRLNLRRRSEPALETNSVRTLAMDDG